MELFNLMSEGGHEQIMYWSDPEFGYRGIIAVHDTTLGPALGGTRFWTYDDDREVQPDPAPVDDALGELLHHRQQRGPAEDLGQPDLDLLGQQAREQHDRAAHEGPDRSRELAASKSREHQTHGEDHGKQTCGLVGS